VSSPGFGVERRWRSEAWERGESKRAIGIGFWDICRARALARRGRRLLQRALHRDGEVAAARTFLGSAARVARPGGLQREATGGGRAPERRVGASATEEVAGKAGKVLHGAGVGAVGGRRRETEQGGGRSR